MPENLAPGVFPPLRLTSLDGTLYSIELRVPSPVSEELERFAAEAEISLERAAGNALMFYRESFMTREDHARENVEWYILNFGPPKPPARRLSHKQHQRLDLRLEREVSEARANGKLGNLFVPANIYMFVRRKIEGGTFASPTEVLEAALPCLLAHRGESPRADFVEATAPPKKRTRSKRVGR
jgi:hypothetical protein